MSGGSASLDTKLMKQWVRIKKDYPNHVLLFQVGKFYELFKEDAYSGNKYLGYKVSSRDGKLPFSGGPVANLDEDLIRWRKHGVNVVVVDQDGDSEDTKIKERKIRYVTSPGTVIDEDNLDLNTSLCAVSCDDLVYTIIAFDIRTLVARVSAGDFLNPIAFAKTLSKFRPVEVLASKSHQFLEESLKKIIAKKLEIVDFSEEIDEMLLQKLNDRELSHGEKICMTMLLKYLNKCFIFDAEQRIRITREEVSNFLEIDQDSYRNLEIEKSLDPSEEGPTLFSTLNETRTVMGSRLLRSWLRHPYGEESKDKIGKRLKIVKKFLDFPSQREGFREIISSIRDPLASLAKLTLKRISIKDIVRLKMDLVAVEQIRFVLGMEKTIPSQQPIIDLIDQYVKLDANNQPAYELYDEQFRKDKEFLDSTNQWILGYNKILAEKYPNYRLSIGVGKDEVFIETSKKFRLDDPDFILLKDLKSKLQYTNKDVTLFQSNLKSAKESMVEFEKKAFQNICEKLYAHIESMRNVFHFVEKMDVLQALAEVAYKNNYCEPVFNEENRFQIEEGRHPFVVPSEGKFVPNSVCLSQEKGNVHIITGANYCGKSSFLRQNALIAIMAQMGSFVPAKSANICYFDKIFTRIGATDNIAKNQSTFSLEMSEVSYILRNATNRSFIIIDEVGRGTCVSAGYSIAVAVCDYIAKKIGAKCLFATHLHEVAALADIDPNIRNFHFAVRAESDSVLFLRNILPGAATKSYGVEVAKMAGLPDEVVLEAKKIEEHVRFEFKNV